MGGPLLHEKLFVAHCGKQSIVGEQEGSILYCVERKDERELGGDWLVVLVSNGL